MAVEGFLTETQKDLTTSLGGERGEVFPLLLASISSIIQTKQDFKTLKRSVHEIHPERSERGTNVSREEDSADELPGDSREPVGYLERVIQQDSASTKTSREVPPKMKQ